MAGGDHYLPAAFIGGFGDSGSVVESRKAEVRVRFAARPAETKKVSAEYVAKEKDIYLLEKPPIGVDPQAINDLWDVYEPRLPKAISAFGRGDWTEDDWSVVSFHILAQGVRSPAFLAQAKDHLEERGQYDARDDAQQMRITTLSVANKLMERSRFLILRTPECCRFVVNDKGWASVAERLKGTVFPLSGHLAILSAVEDAVLQTDSSPDSQGQLDAPNLAPPTQERTLIQSAVEVLNDASWQGEGIRCVIGHPDDEAELMRLDTKRPLVIPRYGPYRLTRELGFFDWALGEQPPDATPT